MKEESTYTGPWRARPVFVSSTFKDMQQERDWLRNHVFGRIDDELRKRRHHLEPIDLRLGVETAQAGTEEARELLVLKVCLDQIKRSRPFLLVLLGDRYGWVPDSDRIDAAAREQGFATSPAGKSVTALEIEFGILKEDPAQRQRSLFFFRRPLPWQQIPESLRADYSDAHSPHPPVRAGHDKLVSLKERLKNDPELGPRVYEYSAQWDSHSNHITGLKAFGDLVYEKLWAAIDEETRAFAAQPPPTWQEQEKAALAEFVEHRSRIFVGRQELIGQLLGICRSPTAAAPMGASAWGACLVGSPGSGKSAVFARLYRELESDPAILLLANAAGGTQRGSSVDAMLRRFITELAAQARVPDPLPERATPEVVEATFYSLLRRVCNDRRVVVLLDALDQSEPTPRGRHLTWFNPRQWPANARIVATALPCQAAEALSVGAGVEAIHLSPLTTADARQIGQEVWGRYHREINPAVLQVLLDKSTDGLPACGNPLWLTLALEQLNLLDADDFTRAQRDFAGSPSQRLTALLIETASRMPPDIGDLYGWLLEQNEKAYGLAYARGFAMAIALSRAGWRDADLMDLVPRLGRLLVPGQVVNDLDELGLATLRRGFRAHLVRRGENAQLDFFHAQMRSAMVQRCAPQEPIRQSLHAAISDYLESLPADDRLIRLELMGQLIGQRNALRAARYYATPEVASDPTTERVGATWTLVEWIATGESRGQDNPNLAWVASWLLESGLGQEQLYRLANNFQFELFKRMENDLGLQPRQRLIEAVRAALERLATSDPSNAEWQRDLSVSHNKIGDVLSAQGDLAGALRAYREALAVAERLASFDPSNAEWQRDLSVSHNYIGNVLSAQGDLAGALRAYRETQTILQRLSCSDPSNAGWQHDLSASHERIGVVLSAQGDLAGALRAYRETQTILQRLASSDPSNAGWQLDLSVSRERIGNVLSAQGDLAGALRAYRETQTILQRLASSDPSNAGWQHALSVSHFKIGEVLRAQGDLAGALRAYRETQTILQRLASSDPSNAWWQRDLSVSHFKIGEVLSAQGDLAGALRAYRETQPILQRLATSDPSNAGWQGDLSVSHNYIGDVLSAQGDLAGALRSYREYQAGMERLATSDPSNAGWQHALSVSHIRIGDVRSAQDDLAGALRAYRETQTILQRLATSDPSNAGWQRDLSVSHNKIGDVLSAQGDLAGTLGAYREALAVAERLTSFDPSNAGWQRDLSVSHNKMGDVLSAQDDLTGALWAYREALAIAERLLSSDPSNAEWQRDLAVSHYRLAKFARQNGNQPEFMAEARACFDVLSAMKQRNLHFDPQLAQVFEYLSATFSA